MKIIISENVEPLPSVSEEDVEAARPDLNIKLEGLLMIKGQHATIQNIKERVARETGVDVSSKVALIENVSYDDTHPVRNLDDDSTLFLVDKAELDMQQRRRRNDGVIASMIDAPRTDNLKQGLVMDLAKPKDVYTHTAMRRYIKFVKIGDHLFAQTVRERWRQYLPLRIIGGIFWCLQISAFVVRRGYILIGCAIILLLYCLIFTAIYLSIHRRTASALSTEKFVAPALVKSIPVIAWWQYLWLGLRMFVFLLLYAAFVGALQRWDDTSNGFRFGFWVVTVIGYNLCLPWESWIVSAHQNLKYYRKNFILPPPCMQYDELKKVTTPLTEPLRLCFDDVEEVFVAVNREMFNYSLASAFQPSERVEHLQPSNMENPVKTAFTEKPTSPSVPKNKHIKKSLQRGATENALRVVDLESNESKIFKEDSEDANGSFSSETDEERVMRLASNEERIHWLCFRCKGAEENSFTIYGIAVKPPRPCFKFELTLMKPNARETGVNRKYLIRLLGVLASCKEQLGVQIEVMQSVLRDL